MRKNTPFLACCFQPAKVGIDSGGAFKVIDFSKMNNPWSALNGTNALALIILETIVLTTIVRQTT